jgi:starch synthase
MLASENDALPGGKVGGIGDVVRDCPPALAALGNTVDVVTPGYGHFSRLPGASHVADLRVWFGGRLETVELLRVPGRVEVQGVELWALEHPLFSCCGAGRIYCDDGDDRPFATDASKFALFCAAVGVALGGGQLARPAAIHLHDWHAATLAVLRSYHPEYAFLQDVPMVFSIHNLALQGIRPQRGDDSSLLAWFPHLAFDQEAVADPRAWDCYNPMRAAINLCDRVHVVSPGYAREILRPSEPWRGFIGGEGLEQDLGRAAGEGRLFGILNGCDYPGPDHSATTFADFIALARRELLATVGRSATVDSAHLIALRRLDALSSGESPSPRSVITSVGRMTDQKLMILCQRLEDGRGALDHLLDRLASDQLLVMLGSGDARLEQYVTEVSGRRDNLIFLKAYSEALSGALYALGQLFLMPSSFEPCGISQMLAMRAGQPCLVHGVGGLADTVRDGEDGFTFYGDSPREQALALLERLSEALDLMRKQPATWKRLCKAAAAARFPWSESAARYVKELYQIPTESS